ncbi:MULTISPECIES: hypothetical protein [Brevibacterium]|uniref:hypothetical protein n=1 Tax=Brevibacterium TaxID=1696 RepID=UPI001E5865EF|nr:hypothetical protein [Brevibacterium casei]MCT1549761.1 hypothetical protein [Brevibacterium casei]MCT1559688.1 hypothetical protein [Brevibacterium casei]MCT2182209.1 hypothetical protein [Brevibacterium casei]MCT2207802.1 hypothetical protein [Brevibacterium casei]
MPIPTPVRSRAATSAAGVLTRVGPRTLLACVCALVLLTVAGCGPDRGLRIEPASTASPTLLNQSNEDAGPPDKPFSLETIRTAIEDASGVAVTGRAAETAEVVGECTDCLKFGAPFTRGEEKFQVVTVANPQQRSEDIAGVVVSEKDGAPRLELIATGNQLTLSPGKNGTLVVQEAMYADGDEDCCPSGWSVQVFRLHDGRFEPGQRFTRLNGES